MLLVILGILKIIKNEIAVLIIKMKLQKEKEKEKARNALFFGSAPSIRGGSRFSADLCRPRHLWSTIYNAGGGSPSSSQLPSFDFIGLTARFPRLTADPPAESDLSSPRDRGEDCSPHSARLLYHTPTKKSTSGFGC